MKRSFACLALACAALPASAQQFPAKPIHFIVPFPPGGSTEVLARLVGQKLTERWNQPIVVETKPGANTLIGAEAAAKAAPDGYTWFMPIDSTLTMNGTLYSKLPYDPAKSFAPVTVLTRQSALIMANPKLPVKTLKELIDYARSNPGKVNYATGAITTQVAGEWLKSLAGIQLVNVRYAGSAPTRAALLGGNVEMGIGDMGPYLPDIKAGRVVALATTGAKRALATPDVPTVAELGFPEYDVGFWYGLVVPAGTPPALIERIRADVTTALNTPEVKDRAASFALEVAPNMPDEFAAEIRAQTEKWAKIIKQTGVKVE